MRIYSSKLSIAYKPGYVTFSQPRLQGWSSPLCHVFLGPQIGMLITIVGIFQAFLL
uniref:Uncharacterized protein n=1 Tax=Arundo donax TaxID=35708 RepID=A0A0A9QLI4_ARUDO